MLVVVAVVKVLLPDPSIQLPQTLVSLLLPQEG